MNPERGAQTCVVCSNRGLTLGKKHLVAAMGALAATFPGLCGGTAAE